MTAIPEAAIEAAAQALDNAVLYAEGNEVNWETLACAAIAAAMPAIREALAQEIEAVRVVVLDSDLDIWHTAMKVQTDAARIVRGGDA